MHSGSPLEDRGYGITVDDDCRLYFCGYFDLPSAQFGTHTLTTLGRKDGFIARIDDGCFIYEIPDAIEDPALSECNPALPNVFTPNTDGVNDCISVSDAWCIESMHCVFYNRWGQVVYQTTDPEFCWNGNDNSGRSLEQGVYFYAYEGKLDNGKTVLRKGTITLLK
jgi:gliding motility-associated-like protein